MIMCFEKSTKTSVNKQEVIDNICYTELVYERINKKLNKGLSKEDIKAFLLKILKETNTNYYIKRGKNIYVVNQPNNIRITINSNTFRVITVDRVT